LRKFHQALVAYSDHHGGDLPKVEKAPPYNKAGIFVPILARDGYLPPDVSVLCPSNGMRSAESVPLDRLQEEQLNQPEQYERDVSNLAGCYAYSLGYSDDAGHHFGLRLERGQNDHLPIIADRPPFEQQVQTPLAGNSLNHGGKGQNVLYLGGNVRFCTDQYAGINRDDIYLNRNNAARAGLDRNDTVLGASGFQPYP
jgi:hypothetical protein